MSEQNPNERLTSAEIKKQIQEASKAEKAKTEVKESGMPITGMLANEINASASSTPPVTLQAASKPEPVKAAEESTNVDYKDWAKKKGIDWTTDDSVLSALHKSDQEFHKRQAERKAKEAVNTPNTSAYNPPPAQVPFPPQNGYQNAYAPQNDQTVVNNLARQYNMAPEDIPKLAAWSKDFFEVAIKSERDRMNAEFESMRIENQKNSVFRELSQDPVFRNPEVGVEYHRVLEEMQAIDPQSFEKDPTAYRRAYDKTLQNIGRRNLEGKPLQEGVPPKARTIQPPSTPPRQLGIGSGGGALENESGFDREAYFNLKSPEEKKAMLAQMGLVSGY